MYIYSENSCHYAIVAGGASDQTYTGCCADPSQSLRTSSSKEAIYCVPGCQHDRWTVLLGIHKLGCARSCVRGRRLQVRCAIMTSHHVPRPRPIFPSSAYLQECRSCMRLIWQQTLQSQPAVQCIAGDAIVRLTVQQQLPFGESLRVAGSGQALGDWDPASAPSKPFLRISCDLTRAHLQANIADMLCMPYASAHPPAG